MYAYHNLCLKYGFVFYFFFIWKKKKKNIWEFIWEFLYDIHKRLMASEISSFKMIPWEMLWDFYMEAHRVQYWNVNANARSFKN